MNNAKSAYLRIDGVTKRFGAVTVVDQINLEIPQGQFVTLLGPSGCGKTTLLRMIAGFYEPDGGAIYLDDRRIDQLPAHQRGAAMVFQDYALFPHMTVADNVGYGLRLAKVAKAEIQHRVMDTLQFVGLEGLGARWPNQLSGGQQQRVALARALIVEPKVLLLDEPLSNLDANLRERMRWELRSLQQRLNITFLYVTHDQSEALAMSDWVAVMHNGHVEQWGTPSEIYHHPQSPFTANFIGSANLRPAIVVNANGETLLVESDGQQFSVPAYVSAARAGKVLLCLRPEAITISKTAQSAPCINLSGTIIRSAFLGHLTRYWLNVNNEEWIVDKIDAGPYDIALGGEVILSFDPAHIHLISG